MVQLTVVATNLWPVAIVRLYYSNGQNAYLTCSFEWKVPLNWIGIAKTSRHHYGIVPINGLVWRGKYLRYLEIRNQNSTSSKISIINTAAITFYTCVIIFLVTPILETCISVFIQLCYGSAVTLGPWLAQCYGSAVTLGSWLAQVHTYPVGTWNSSKSASKCFATHKNGTHLYCVPDPRVTLGPWLAQVHTYPVGTWNSSESASKCFATHKNGTHLYWSACKYLLVVVTPPVLWIRRDVGSLVGTGTHLPCGYMEQLKVCLKVLCNSQEWHPSPLCSGSARDVGSLVGSCTHLPCGYMEQLRVCLKVLCNSQEWHPSPLSAHDVGSLVGAGTHLPCGYMEQLRDCLKVLCNSQEWHPSPLVSLYTPTLWVHGTAQRLPQSALQLTRMAPISTGQLVHTYPVGTWNSSESASK
ncbi:hypothetical protein EMCRGX_G000472 [Ephydatia muelleri]